MSKESDLQALRALRDELIKVDMLKKSINDKENSIKNLEQHVIEVPYNLLPTNAYSELKKKYQKEKEPMAKFLFSKTIFYLMCILSMILTFVQIIAFPETLLHTDTALMAFFFSITNILLIYCLGKGFHWLAMAFVWYLNMLSLCFSLVSGFVLQPLLVIISIILTIATKKWRTEMMDKYKNKFSSSQKKALYEALSIDQKNAEVNDNEKQKAEAILQEKIQEFAKKEIDPAKIQLERLKAKLEKHLQTINEATIIAQDDKYLYGVEYLISRLESRRADTLKEALLQLDVQKKENNRNAQAEMDRFFRNLEREEEERKQRERDSEEAMYRAKMKRLEEERLEELKKLNKKLDS